MKKLAFVLVLPFVLSVIAGCSSGSTQNSIPDNISGLYRGAFESSNGLDAGVMILNIAEDTSNDVQGTVQFEFTKTDLTCLRNATISGTTSGFAVNLESEQGSGTLTMQLTSSTNTLSGTYVTSGDPCSNFSGSGSIVLRK